MASVRALTLLALAACAGGDPTDSAGPAPERASAADRAAVLRDTQRLHGAIVVFYVRRSTYPERLEDLLGDGLAGEGVLDVLPRDPWGEPYVYRLADDACVLTSPGPDRTPGTADDLENRWEEYTGRLPGAPGRSR